MQAPHFRRSRFFIQPITMPGFVLFVLFVAWCAYSLMGSLFVGADSFWPAAPWLLLQLLLGALVYFLLALAMNWWALRKK